MLALVFLVAYIAASYAIFTAKYNVVFTTQEEEDRIAKEKRQALVDRIKPCLSITELEEVMEDNSDKLKECHYDILEIAYGLTKSELKFDLRETLAFILVELGVVARRADSYILA